MFKVNNNGTWTTPNLTIKLQEHWTLAKVIQILRRLRNPTPSDLILNIGQNQRTSTFFLAGSSWHHKSEKKPPTTSLFILERMMRPYKNENVLYEELKQIKDLIKDHHPDCENIFISCPIVRTDNKKANNILKKYIDTLKREEHSWIPPI